MKNLSDLAGEELIIKQPSKLKNYFELKYNDDVLGSIYPSKFFGSSRTVDIFSNQFQFYRPHFWKSEIAIKETNKELPFAKYSRDRFKSQGTVYLEKGEQLKIIFKVFKGCFFIQNLAKDRLVRFNYNILFKEKTTLIIEQKSELLDESPWVIFLAWHLSIRRRRIFFALAGG